MSYKNLEIWKLADELVAEIHEMTLTKLPNLGTLFKIRSLQDEVAYNYLHAKLVSLGKKINLFIKGVDDTNWGKPVTRNQ